MRCGEMRMHLRAIRNRPGANPRRVKAAVGENPRRQCGDDVYSGGWFCGRWFVANVAAYLLDQLRRDLEPVNLDGVLAGLGQNLVLRLTLKGLPTAGHQLTARERLH